MPARIIKLSEKEKKAIGGELKKHLNNENKKAKKKVVVLGMIACNVYAFAHSTELGEAWGKIMRLKSTNFSADAGHYGAIRDWEEIPQSVTPDREAFRNPHLTQRFDIIVTRIE